LKSTGIVRRIDPLGRVVIPREIRSVFAIQEKDALEIFTESNTIIFRKYEPHCVLCCRMEEAKNYRGKWICQACVDFVRLEFNNVIHE
jgi:transcriptional pleiotropic regulator of transition state genes